MFSLRTLIICIIYAAVLYCGHRLETQLARRNSPRPGLILPIVAVIAAAVLSFRNFWIAWDIVFSPFAFLAAVALFVFYAVPAIYFILLYIEGRKEARARKQARSARVRQAKTQQRVQSNLQHRYDKPLEKQEPIVYMPERRTTTSPRTSTRRQANSGSRTRQMSTSDKNRKY